MAWCIYKVHPVENECLTVADTKEQAMEIGQEWITPGETFFIAAITFGQIQQFTYKCVEITHESPTTP